MYAYARTGLLSFVDAAAPDEGTVLLPSYIARGVVWAFRQRGYDVHYYPVTDRLGLPADTVRDRIAGVDPDVVLLAHYFGFADPGADAVVTAARRAGALVVEDCARGLFSRDTDGTLLGTAGDAAIFCLHKVLAVPHGGLVVAPGTDLAPPTRPIRERNDLARSVALAAARSLRVPLSPGNVDDAPVEPTKSPDDVTTPEGVWPPTRPNSLSWRGLAATNPSQVRANRCERYAALRTALRDRVGSHVVLLTPPLHAGACPYGVAFRPVEGESARNRLYAALRGRGYPAECLRWRPIEGERPGRWNGGASTIRRSMLVVPTHQQLPMRAIERMVGVVETVLAGGSG